VQPYIDLMSLAAVRPVSRGPAIEVEGLHRSFGSVHALRGIDLEVALGEVHALLGPNGAGKTTLMRILSGLVDPTEGSAYVLDQRAGRSPALRALIGMVPPGDRTFYLRLSGLENLAFFARLHGLRRKAARARSLELLEAVGLGEAAKRPISTYSHGMQKRLSFARALLVDPQLLLVDEATHDLDPVAAQQVRDLTAASASRGAAVLWATQRIEELHGFAARVTVLDHGSVAFSGSVATLAAMGSGDRHILQLAPGSPVPGSVLDGLGTLEPAPGEDASHVLLALAPDASLGAAIAALASAGAEIVSCRDERPPIERAFLAVTGESAGADSLASSLRERRGERAA
jgi:ABC-type multidrug transport system ATPase subunit